MVSLLSPSVMTLAILIVSCVFFMSGKVRSDIVALCALLALLIFGILTPAEALSGFASPVVIMMVGLFVVGAGIFRTGLAKMISSRILRIGGKNENVLFVLVMLVTALIGAFVSNTGTVAVMLPIVMSMAASSGISSSRYLMPMAFASSMGLFTLISTPPNLVIQEALVDAGMEPLGFFSFAPVGAVVVAVGIGVLYFLSRLLVRKDEGKRNVKRKAKTLAELVEEYNLVHLSFQVEVPAASPMVGRSLKAQMKYADKLGAQNTIVLGTDELSAGECTLLHMATGEKKRIPLCVQLLRRAASDVLPHHQLVLGLKRLRKGLGELQLDVPRAEELLAQVCEALEAAKLVTEDELRVWRV